MVILCTTEYTALQPSTAALHNAAADGNIMQSTLAGLGWAGLGWAGLGDVTSD